MSSYQYENVKVRINKRIAIVSLNRPEKLNGLNYQMFKDFLACAKQLKKDKDLRVIILQGEGESFSAGLDFGEMMQNYGNIAKLFLKLPFITKANDFQRMSQVWRDMPIPVIAVIQGHCFGGGMQIAMGADFRFASTDAQLSIMEMKWGLIPDMGIMSILSAHVRQDIAKELIMTGRIFSGAQAKEYGLVMDACDTPMDAALELAERIAKQSPSAVSAAKRLCHNTWQVSQRKALFWERWIQTGILGRANQRIALANNKKGANKREFVNR